jgi:hypothetical protein
MGMYNRRIPIPNSAMNASTPETLSLQNFPLLAASVRKPDYLVSALEDVRLGLQTGAIRNAVWQELKFTLSRMVEELWKQRVSGPFFYAGQYEQQSEEVNALNDGILIMGLHDVLSAAKKIQKSTTPDSDPAVAAMRAYVAEILPLSLAVASLKDKVVKGRAPRTEPAKPQNPNKVVRTCPVCFRAIAVVGGTMAHHGYKRPGSGWQTSSCPGVRFKQLEVSSEGLSWLIGQLQEKLKTTQAAHRRRHQMESFHVPRRRTLVLIHRESEDWEREFESMCASWLREIGSLKKEIPLLEKKLADWVATE